MNQLIQAAELDKAFSILKQSKLIDEGICDRSILLNQLLEEYSNLHIYKKAKELIEEIHCRGHELHNESFRAWVRVVGLDLDRLDTCRELYREGLIKGVYFSLFRPALNGVYTVNIPAAFTRIEIQLVLEEQLRKMQEQQEFFSNASTEGLCLAIKIDALNLQEGYIDLEEVNLVTRKAVSCLKHVLAEDINPGLHYTEVQGPPQCVQVNYHSCRQWMLFNGGLKTKPHRRKRLRHEQQEERRKGRKKHKRVKQQTNSASIIVIGDSSDSGNEDDAKAAIVKVEDTSDNQRQPMPRQMRQSTKDAAKPPKKKKKKSRIMSTNQLRKSRVNPTQANARQGSSISVTKIKEVWDFIKGKDGLTPYWNTNSLPGDNNDLNSFAKFGRATYEAIKKEFWPDHVGPLHRELEHSEKEIIIRKIDGFVKNPSLLETLNL